MNLPPSATATTKDRQIDTIRNILTGAQARRPVTEFYTSTDLDELEAELNGLELDVDSPPELVIRKTLLAAAFRDLRYAGASRGHMLALGGNNAIRETFETVKILLDSGQQL